MSTEIAEKAGEIAAENVEDAVGGVVEIVEVVKNNPVALAGAWGLGLAAGVGIGYFVAQKLLERQFDERLVEEIAEAKQFYADINKTDLSGRPLSPQEMMDKLHGEGAAAKAVEALETYQGRIEGENPGIPKLPDTEEEELLAKTVSKVKVAEEVEEKNVFDDGAFDLEVEKTYRTKDKPYIITHDEYYAGELDYDTVELTYFEMDDTLVDENDTPIEKVEQIVGVDHLVRFGSGARDKNTVHIRNDRLETDYVITKSKKSYLEEVLGMSEEEPKELKHSDQRDRRRAFRHGDE